MPKVGGVVLESGSDRPLEGVRISVAPDSTTVAVTDSAGAFSIEALNPGRFRIVPSKEGFVYARPARLQIPREPGVWVQVPASGSIEDLELRMEREGVIVGTVLGANGRPVYTGSVGAVLRTFDKTGNLGIEAVLGGKVNDQGAYRIFGLQRGDYYLRVIGAPQGILSRTYYPGTPDLERATLIRVNPGEEARVGPIYVQPITTADVRFHFEDDKSVPGIRNLTLSDDVLVSAAPHDQDNFVVSGLISGDYAGLLSLSTPSGLAYSRFELNVGNSTVDMDVTMRPGLRTSGRVILEDASGSRLAPPEIKCQLRSRSAGHYLPDRTRGCIGAQLAPGSYWLEMQGMPADAYVRSVSGSGKDLLPLGNFDIEQDIELNIVVTSPGGVIRGNAEDSNGQKLGDAIVALIPDAPLRSSGLLYRSAVTDSQGNFELRGIAPGAYHLFAWQELNGAAYHNADFIKEFDERGLAVHIEGETSLTVNITTF